MNKIERIIFYSVIILALGIFIHDRYLASKINNQLVQQEVSTKPIPIIAKPVITYKDSSGIKHTVILGNANSIKEAQINLKGTLGVLDTVSSKLTIAKDKIDKLTNVNFELQQQNINLKAERDTLKKKTTYHYKDKYLTLDESKEDSSTNLVANYLINTDLNWVDYSKRNWFLGIKRQYTDIFSMNPNITIRGINRVSIEHSVSQFGLKLKASSNYEFYNKSLAIGPGIAISIKRFDIFGYYYYYPTSNLIKQWYPSIKVDYNLISF